MWCEPTTEALRASLILVLSFTGRIIPALFSEMSAFSFLNLIGSLSTFPILSLFLPEIH